jgi:hypothetical protein
MTGDQVLPAPCAGEIIFKKNYVMKYLPLVLILLFSSCMIQQPITSQVSQNNTDYKVDYLFEHEGCKVYRFTDRGNVVYFTNCNGEAISKTDSTEIRNSINLKKN